MNKTTKIIIGAASVLVGAVSVAVAKKVNHKTTVDILKTEGLDITEENVKSVEHVAGDVAGHGYMAGASAAGIALLLWLTIDELHRANKQSTDETGNKMIPSIVLGAIAGFFSIGGGIILGTVLVDEGGNV